MATGHGSPAGGGLKALAERLRDLCPAVAPDVLPIGDLTPNALGVLLGRDAEDGDAVSRLLEDALVACKECSITQARIEGGGAGMVLQWRVDPMRMHFVLESCRFSSGAIADLLHTRRTIALLCSGAVEVEAAATQLARANGLNDRDPTAIRVWMQECFSVAYAMKVVANNMGKWTYVVDGAGSASDRTPTPSAPHLATLLAMNTASSKDQSIPASKRKQPRAPSDTQPRHKPTFRSSYVKGPLQNDAS